MGEVSQLDCSYQESTLCSLYSLVPCTGTCWDHSHTCAQLPRSCWLTLPIAPTVRCTVASKRDIHTDDATRCSCCAMALAAAGGLSGVPF